MWERIHELDCAWSLWMHKKGLLIPRIFLRFLEYSGDGVFWIPATAALWFAPSVQESSRLQLFVLNLFLGLLVDLVVVATMKLLIQRPRPIYNKGMYLIVSVDHWSFPSGHSSRALFMASFLWMHAALWEGFLFLGFEVFVLCWAMTTALSRVLLGRHYFFDVVVGSCLGSLEAFAVERWLSSSVYHDMFRNMILLNRV